MYLHSILIAVLAKYDSNSLYSLMCSLKLFCDFENISFRKYARFYNGEHIGFRYIYVCILLDEGDHNAFV